MVNKFKSPIPVDAVYFKYFLVFFLTFLLDQMSKLGANHFQHLFHHHLEYGLQLTLEIYHNKGIFLGIFSKAKETFRIVFFTGIYGLIFFIYLGLIYFLPFRMDRPKIWLSVYLGAISGNVFDRAFFGYVTDFIRLSFSASSHPYYFNLADLAQMIAAAFIICLVIKERKRIWFPGNNRSRVIIMPKLQLNYALKMAIVCFGLSFTLGIHAYSIFKHAGIILNPQVFAHFIVGHGLLTLVFSLITFFLGLLFAHRLAGPFYAFQIFLRDLFNSKRRSFKLREDDNFKELEVMAETILREWEKRKRRDLEREDHD